MEFVLGLAQTCHPKEGSVLELVDCVAAKAKKTGVDLLVFPESLMTRYEKELGDFLAAAEPLDGEFCSGVNAIAAKYGLWMVYTANELNPEGRPFNTAVVVDDEGVICGAYRKTHLFDTDFTRESDRMGKGGVLFDPIDTPFGRIGLGICYDLRFPEVARFAALRGADMLFYPAAWVDGKLKADQWRTLLRARAIENELFVAGVSRADAGYIGQSCVIDPQGVVVAAGGPDEDLVVTRVDTAKIAEARSRMPVLDHRRPQLYEG